MSVSTERERSASTSIDTGLSGSAPMPSVLVGLIGHFLAEKGQVETLVSLMCCSKSSYEAVGPVLYRFLDIDSRHLRALTLGLETSVRRQTIMPSSDRCIGATTRNTWRPNRPERKEYLLSQTRSIRLRGTPRRLDPWKTKIAVALARWTVDQAIRPEGVFTPLMRLDLHDFVLVQRCHGISLGGQAITRICVFAEWNYHLKVPIYESEIGYQAHRIVEHWCTGAQLKELAIHTRNYDSETRVVWLRSINFDSIQRVASTMQRCSKDDYDWHCNCSAGTFLARAIEGVAGESKA